MSIPIFQQKVSFEPVDKSARLVTKKATYNEKFQYENNHSAQNDNNLKKYIEKALENRIKYPPNKSKNYTGQKRGRISIIYYSHSRQPKNPKKDLIKYWLAECKCGNYELRTNISLGKNRTDDMCEYCKRIEFLKEKAIKMI